MARSDRITATSATPEIRSDVDASFALNPVTGGISRVVNEQAVAQAIRLTLLTMNGEWPFEPDNGTAVVASLFEPDDAVSLNVLADTIETAVANRCASYATLRGVRVSPAQDSRSVAVDVSFSMVGSDRIATVRAVLRRVR